MCPNKQISVMNFSRIRPKHTVLEIQFRSVKSQITAVTKIRKNFEQLFIPMPAMQAITVQKSWPLQKVVKLI